MTLSPRLLIALPVLALAACTTIPSGPSEYALPGTGRSFDQFRADDGDCRSYANAQIGAKDPNQAGAESTAKSAALGAGIGAVAGAAIGNSSRSAGAGAGMGLIVGALAGIGAGDTSSWALQRRYDVAYKQCMYSKGHKVPVRGNMAYDNSRAAPAVQPAPLVPPPPPGR